MFDHNIDPNHVPGLALVTARAGHLTAQEHTETSGHGFVVRDAMTAGRLISPWQREVAVTSLWLAAMWQGKKHDAEWGEEPGRIPHEVVFPGGLRTADYLGLEIPQGPFASYFSADSTAEWVVTLAVVANQDVQLRGDLYPHWTAAGQYLLNKLDDGDGLLRWGPRPEAWRGTGLNAQGWRDGRDGVPPVAGSLDAPGMVADWDVQASLLLALRALAWMSSDTKYSDAARALEARINQSFDPNHLGLDGNDQPIPGAGTAAASLLWAGALNPEQRERAIGRLLAEDLWTPYGFRSLATTDPAYDQSVTRGGAVNSYHSYLAVCGLARNGKRDEAVRIAEGMADAIDRLGDYPQAWGFEHGLATGPLIPNSLWTIAVRRALKAALEAEWFDNAGGLAH
jgi:glycogen debranching enzyme